MAATTSPAGKGSARFLNRDLSWLAFNERVLHECLVEEVPLVERLRFLTIFYTNLDEFYMVRVSGLMQQLDAGIEAVSTEGLSVAKRLALIQHRVRKVTVQAQEVLSDKLLPALASEGVHIVRYHELDASAKSHWDEWYRQRVQPILTPLAVGPTHRFPFISNLSFNLALMVKTPAGDARLARVKIPLQNLPRLLRLKRPKGQDPSIEQYLPIEDLISANLEALFPNMEVGTAYPFRVTRDADLEIKEDEADDLLEAMQQGLRVRRFGQAVRLEVADDTPEEICSALLRGVNLDATSMYRVKGLMSVPDLHRLLRADRPALRFRPTVPRQRGDLSGTDLFATIKMRDVLVHHPFDGFRPVVDFVRAAAADPDVLAIKQTLYRTSGDSQIIRALQHAVEQGKQVAAIVELKARFDEENNIVWAQRLEASGVHVIYGVPGLKTHAKLCLVVRREGDTLVRYCHIGTGNYNETTARVYTDLGLFSARPEIVGDVAQLFNALTGFSMPSSYARLLVAPNHMKRALLQHIRDEETAAREGRDARMILKCNAVVDKDVIEALYCASEAGVEIDLLVRGICCAVPGVKGMSSNIRVKSVVGRFLEHHRVYYFHNGGDSAVYVGSADLMDRNLDRRVEVLAPVEDQRLKTWLVDYLLKSYLDDTSKSHVMNNDGSYAAPQTTATSDDLHHRLLMDLGSTPP